MVQNKIVKVFMKIKKVCFKHTTNITHSTLLIFKPAISCTLVRMMIQNYQDLANVNQY